MDYVREISVSSRPLYTKKFIFMQVYKKKTEAAKKEYLQALAAYRASLVSKGAAENEQQHPQQQPQQQPSPQQQQVQYTAYGSYAGNGTPGNVSYQVYSPQPQPSSPQQQHPHPHPHQQLQHHQQPAQQMQIKKSPHHLTMPGNSQQQQTQQVIIFLHPFVTSFYCPLSRYAS